MDVRLLGVGVVWAIILPLSAAEVLDLDCGSLQLRTGAQGVLETVQWHQGRQAIELSRVQHGLGLQTMGSTRVRDLSSTPWRELPAASVPARRLQYACSLQVQQSVVSLVEDLELSDGQGAETQGDRLTLVQRYRTDRLLRPFYALCSFQLEPLDLVWRYDRRAQRFIFRRVTDGACFSLTVSGAPVHNGSLLAAVPADGASVRTGILAPVMAPEREQPIRDRDGQAITSPMVLSVTMLVAELQPRAPLTITVALRFARDTKTLLAAWGGETTRAPATLTAVGPGQDPVAERNRLASWIVPQTEDCLVVPRPNAPATMPVLRVAGGQSTWGIAAGTDLRPWAFAVLPWQPGYEDFLGRWSSAASDDDWLGLAAFCRERTWPELERYAALQVLSSHFCELDHPSYRKALGIWLPLARNLRSDLVLDLPVEGEWWVERDETGHHARKYPAAFAVDLCIMRGGRPCAGTGRTLADHWCFGKPVLAPAEALVEVADGAFPDMPIGTAGKNDESNNIILDLGGGLRILLGHLKQGSVLVKPGDRVRPGQRIAAVGNSGASGMPHLHLTVANQDYESIPGRFRCETQAQGRWKPCPDGPLSEGCNVRPLAGRTSDQPNR